MGERGNLVASWWQVGGTLLRIEQVVVILRVLIKKDLKGVLNPSGLFNV
jgi:hypothetical protein